ncbi:F-box protein At3g07870-like [Cornus florida]|uniref:F-box protein At3g07870-like n=1 Tax=Cornus florida TaxID=4283 RepID=UPI0028974443|nr:F-box protein At3g07870-like [Cornus florida]
MSDFLPRDVFIDVLTRLPIRTLVRCACVCKSWYSLLTNPNFITTHLNADNNDNLLLIRRRSGDDGNVVHYSLLLCKNEMFCDYAELELPLKTHSDPFLRIIGCCNGLVCLYNDLHNSQEELYLWNPSIQNTLALPPLQNLQVKFRSDNLVNHSIGFGFDSVTDDYKVVRIVYLNGPSSFRTPPEIGIFSLSTGTWRNISHLGLPYTIYERAPQAYLNGAAHWLAWDWRRRSNLIVSFHMGDEVFGEIMVPSSIFCDYVEKSVCVAKFQESLSLIAGISGEDTCCIWVMKEYGISESWTKQFNIDTKRGSFNSVAGFTRKGEILFGTNAGNLVAYDLVAKQVMRLHIHGCTDPWSGDSFYADAYTESLVLLGAKFRDSHL